MRRALSNVFDAGGLVSSVLAGALVIGAGATPALAWQNSAENNVPTGCQVVVQTEPAAFDMAAAAKACKSAPTKFDADARALINGIDWNLVESATGSNKTETLRSNDEARLDRQGVANEIRTGGVNLQIQLGGENLDCNQRKGSKGSKPINTTAATVLLDKRLGKVGQAQQAWVAGLVKRRFSEAYTGLVKVKIEGECPAVEQGLPPIKFATGWTASDYQTKLDEFEDKYKTGQPKDKPKLAKSWARLKELFGAAQTKPADKEVRKILGM